MPDDVARLSYFAAVCQTEGALDIVPKDVLHHRVSGSLEAECQVGLLSAGVVFLDVESQANHIG